jgi:two-component system NtrC family sensor kinase
MYGDLLRSAKLASLGEMATGLAHEINNPLATLCAEQTNIGDLLSELSGNDSTKTAIHVSVERCKRQIDRCSNITGKMLQFGRRGDGDLYPSDVGPIIEEVSRLLTPQARLKNIALRVEIEPSIPRVFLNPTELEQVLVNLINNAMHAIQQRGTINIALQRANGQAEISVQDDGCGIAPGDLDKIFQPFFTTKPVGEGTGLGLAVSYGIVQAWGGTIHADSGLGVGTRISVLLPIPADQNSSKKHGVSQSSPEHGGGVAVR